MSISKIIFKCLTVLFKKQQANTNKDTYILFDDLNTDFTECIDMYSLFLYMQDNNIKSYYLIRKKNPKYKKIKNNANVIGISKRGGGLEFFLKTYKILLHTRAVLTSFGELRSYLQDFLYKNRYIDYIFMQHGVVYYKNHIIFDKDYISSKKYNKLLVSSEREKDIFLNNSEWDSANILEVGLPRWDLLKKNNLEKNIFIMFTWRNSFRENKDIDIRVTKYYKKIISFLKHKKFNKFCVENNIKIYYTFHHMFLDSFSNISLNELQNFNFIPTDQISETISKTSLFITDYSSIAFDFLYLDIPVIFYRLDHLDKALCFDIENMQNVQKVDGDLFNVIYDEENLIDKIIFYSENDFILEKENTQKAENFFKTKNNIRKKIMEVLERL